MHLPAMDAIQFLLRNEHITEREGKPRLLLANNNAIRHNYFSWIAQKAHTAGKIGAPAGGLAIKQLQHLITYLKTHLTTRHWNNQPPIFAHRFVLFPNYITVQLTLSPYLSSQIAKITPTEICI